MNPEKESPENQIEEFVLDGSASLDDFIKELEEKEKDLHISSDLEIEIGESGINELDDLEILKFLDSCQETNSANGVGAKRSVADYSQYSENVSKLENEVVKLREKVSKFETERSEVNELTRRRQYDFDNYRKRTERERGEILRNLVSNMATEILPVLDNLKRALDSASALPVAKSNDFQQFVDGVGLVNQQLNEVLEEMGIQPIICVGKPFDPHLHEAVATERTDAFPPHTVIAELVRGYQLDDKIIRHALVKVSTSTSSQTE